MPGYRPSERLLEAIPISLALEGLARVFNLPDEEAHCRIFDRGSRGSRQVNAEIEARIGRRAIE